MLLLIRVTDLQFSNWFSLSSKIFSCLINWVFYGVKFNIKVFYATFLWDLMSLYLFCTDYRQFWYGLTSTKTTVC